MRDLVAGGADVNATFEVISTPESDSMPGFTSSHSVNGPLLYWATQKGDAQIVQILVDAGADVNAIISEEGSSSPLGYDTETGPLLYWAIQKRDAQIVQILVEAGGGC